MQEDPRLHVPGVFLDQYLHLARSHAGGVISRLVNNIDKTGCSDWREQKRYQESSSADRAEVLIHFGITGDDSCKLAVPRHSGRDGSQRRLQDGPGDFSVGSDGKRDK
jgi:hypothetical protein